MMKQRGTVELSSPWVTSRAMMGARAILPVLLCCWLCTSPLWGFPFKAAFELDVTPRVTVFSNGLLGRRVFAGPAVNYSTLLLEEKAGVLYVGARGAVFALDTANISTPANNQMIEWEASAGLKRQCISKGRDNQTQCFNHVRFLQRFNETHLYTCGTYAFRPSCAYIDVQNFTMASKFEDGREKCPYDPAKGYTGLFVDGEMYSASQYEFRSSPDIRRNYPYPTVKTEDAPTRWLLDADFVGSALVRESVNSSIGDDDKVYFFFTEKQEQSPYSGQTRVARVARVCKGDWGGQRTLQKRWTSFLKARLVCFLPDYEVNLNVLRSMFMVEGQDPQSSVFYGVFGLEWKNVKTSAICRYSIVDFQKAFEGPFMENLDSRWTEYTGKVPVPRPGSCITDQLRASGINSSRDLPDDVLNFVRRHPLVSKNILPQGDRPLLFKRSVDYTKIIVHRVSGLDRQPYDVLFIGTDDGWLHRAVEVGGRVHIIEELQLFEVPQPVDSMVISSAQKSIYVGSPTGVVQLPLSTCRRYTSCFDCIFTRDPFCAWDGAVCVEVESRKDRSNLTQDILNGKRGCERTTGDEQVVHRTRSVMSGDDVLLPCELRSNLATPRWTQNDRELKGYGLETGYRIGIDGLLLIGARPEQSGSYGCFAEENEVRVLVGSYTVQVRADPSPTRTLLPLPTEQPLPSPPAPLPQTFWDKETMYITLVTILAGLCLVLIVVLLYMTYCVHAGAGRGRKSSLPASFRLDRKRSSHLELKTISSHCNGKREERAEDGGDGFLQIVPGEGRGLPSKEPLPPAPPLPTPPPLPSAEYTNGLSATLPSVLRKMNGNSYMLLQQADAETISPLCHSFTEELNRILEKRKHNQLVTKPDESSV